MLAEILIQLTSLDNRTQRKPIGPTGSQDEFDADVASFARNETTVGMNPDFHHQHYHQQQQQPQQRHEKGDSRSKDRHQTFQSQQRQPRVLVVAATNRPEDCDSALLRRFAIRMLVDVPSARDRQRILRKFSTDFAHSLSKTDVRKIVEQTDGWSGSDLESLVREAAMAPVRECLREAARVKRKARKAEQKSGDESGQERQSTETKGNSTVAGGDPVRELLVTKLQDLRPVTFDDFERSISILMGQTTTARQGNSGDNDMNIYNREDRRQTKKRKRGSDNKCIHGNSDKNDRNKDCKAVVKKRIDDDHYDSSSSSDSSDSDSDSDLGD